MGEDFLRRRNDRFVRQRDAYFARLVERDLFSLLPPDITETVNGSILGEVANDVELWSVELEAGRPIRFYCGAEPIVEVRGRAAEALTRTFGESGAELLAQVLETDVVEGIAVLQVRSVR